jgi:uncharacterized iron-regulated membrane protein
MSANNSRRDVLKKIATTGIVGSGLLASTGTAAAADSSYEIEAGLKAGASGYYEYQIFVPYGEDGNWGVTGDSDTEKYDSLYADDDRGGVEIQGNLDTADDDLRDTWIIDSMSSNYEIDHKPDDVYISDTL